jgi:hypothetical protein
MRRNQQEIGISPDSIMGTNSQTCPADPRHPD